MALLQVVSHGSFDLRIDGVSSPNSGWDEIVGTVEFGNTNWLGQLGFSNLLKGQSFTTEVPIGGQMYVYDHSPRRVPGGYSVAVKARGTMQPLILGEAKRNRDQYEGGVESVVVEPANVAFNKETKTMWAHDGTDWFDTQQAGSPAPGMLTVASASGLPSSLVVSHRGDDMVANVTIGNAVRFSIPRVTIVDTYIADGSKFDPASGIHSMSSVSAGTGAGVPIAEGQLVGGTEAAPPNLPNVMSYAAPSQQTAVVVPWGWVLVSRVAQPAAPGYGDLIDPPELYLVTDTFTWFQSSEFN